MSTQKKNEFTFSDWQESSPEACEHSLSVMGSTSNSIELTLWTHSYSPNLESKEPLCKERSLRVNLGPSSWSPAFFWFLKMYLQKMKYHSHILIILYHSLGSQLSSEITVSKILQTKLLLTGLLYLVAVAAFWSYKYMYGFSCFLYPYQMATQFLKNRW